MALKSEDLRPLHILVPADLKERLKAMAEARDRSVAAETRRAIEHELTAFEAGHREPAHTGSGS